MIKNFMIILLLISCTNLIDSTLVYDSIRLDGGTWIQINNNQENIDLEALGILEGNFTLEFWISGGINNNNNSPALLMISNDNEEIELGIFRDINIPNYLRIIWAGQNIDVDFFDYEIGWNNSDTFYYLTFVFNALENELEIFLNGEWITNIGSLPSLNINENDLFLGAVGYTNDQKIIIDNPTNNWKGYFDEFRIWDIPLNDYYYYDILVNSYTSESYEEGNNYIIINDSLNCMVDTEWDINNGFYQELTNFSEQNYYNFSDGGCYCNQNEEQLFDCWEITPIIVFHSLYSEKISYKYGDPIINNLICQLSFNKYNKKIDDNSGNQNNGIVYSLHGYNASFSVKGY